MAPINVVLDCVAFVCPRVFTVVEQEADHNKPGFLDRFIEVLFYYSAVFDSLDAASGGEGDVAAEAYLECEICDIVCDEGADRREQHEPLWRCRDRLGRTGAGASHRATQGQRAAVGEDAGGAHLQGRSLHREGCEQAG